MRSKTASAFYFSSRNLRAPNHVGSRKCELATWHFAELEILELPVPSVHSMLSVTFLGGFSGNASPEIRAKLVFLDRHLPRYWYDIWWHFSSTFIREGPFGIHEPVNKGPVLKLGTSLSLSLSLYIYIYVYDLPNNDQRISDYDWRYSSWEFQTMNGPKSSCETKVREGQTQPSNYEARMRRVRCVLPWTGKLCFISRDSVKATLEALNFWSAI